MILIKISRYGEKRERERGEKLNIHLRASQPPVVVAANLRKNISLLTFRFKVN